MRSTPCDSLALGDFLLEPLVGGRELALVRLELVDPASLGHAGRCQHRGAPADVLRDLLGGLVERRLQSLDPLESFQQGWGLAGVDPTPQSRMGRREVGDPAAGIVLEMAPYAARNSFRPRPLALPACLDTAQRAPKIEDDDDR